MKSNQELRQLIKVYKKQQEEIIPFLLYLKQHSHYIYNEGPIIIKICGQKYEFSYREIYKVKFGKKICICSWTYEDPTRKGKWEPKILSCHPGPWIIDLDMNKDIVGELLERRNLLKQLEDLGVKV